MTAKKKRSEMSPAEFRAALTTLGLSWWQAVDRLGLTIRTVAAYSSGESPIPAPTARLIRLWLQIKTMPREVRARFEEVA